MKNYNEIIKNVKNYGELEVIVENYNTDNKNKEDIIIDFIDFEKVVKGINDNIKKEFYKSLCYKLSLDGRSAMFTELATHPSYEIITYKVDNDKNITLFNGSYCTKSGKYPNWKTVDLSILEKEYQLFKSVENDTKGKPIPNKAFSIFAEPLVKDCASAIYNNLLLNHNTDDYTLKVSQIAIGKSKTLTKKEVESFKEFSKSKIDTQLNALMKFFELNITIKKSSQFALYQQILKMNKDKKNNIINFDTITTDNFINVIFSEICRTVQDKELSVNTKDKDGNVTNILA